MSSPSSEINGIIFHVSHEMNCNFLMYLGFFADGNMHNSRKNKSLGIETTEANVDPVNGSREKRISRRLAITILHEHRT